MKQFEGTNLTKCTAEELNTTAAPVFNANDITSGTYKLGVRNKYYGKRYLYTFLKNYGYEVPKINEMQYDRYRGNEWLKSFLCGVKVFSPCRGVIYVTVSEIDEVEDRIVECEYSKYVYGVLNYQKKYGEVTYLDGNRVDRTGS